METEPYGDFVRRVIRGYGRRIGDGEIDELGALLELPRLIDAVAANAVASLRDEPHSHSWAAIGDAVGITRQAAMARWRYVGHGARQPGGQPARLR